ncbi:unannotated protein [freshwater metagenome]|uniref:Unannotated protein n=1 Tax=freshwater metagenome TaxID=449393 RepID=A0A6J7ELY9_9ZZZZ
MLGQLVAERGEGGSEPGGCNRVGERLQTGGGSDPRRDALARDLPRALRGHPGPGRDLLTELVEGHHGEAEDPSAGGELTAVGDRVRRGRDDEDRFGPAIGEAAHAIEHGAGLLGVRGPGEEFQ